MHVTATSQKSDFIPLELTLRIESLDELQSIYFMFNWAPLCDGLAIIDVSESVRGELCNHDGRACESRAFDKWHTSVKRHVR
jgi:hypothetical protein